MCFHFQNVLSFSSWNKWKVLLKLNQHIKLNPTNLQYPLINYLGLLTKVSVQLLPQQSKSFLLWIPTKLLIVIKSQKLIQASWSFWRSSFFLQLWATLGLFLQFYFAGKCFFSKVLYSDYGQMMTIDLKYSTCQKHIPTPNRRSCKR